MSDPIILGLEFDAESPEFARGFEVGYCYFAAKASTEPFAVRMHPENVEMALRVAESTRRAVHSEELPGEEAVLVCFARKGSRVPS